MTIRRPGYHPNWKQRLTGLLRELGMIDENYTGNVRLDISQGSVRAGQREEHLR